MAKKKASALEADVSTGAGPATAVKNILLRIVAVFAASGLSVIGAGSLVGISVAQAVILAGALGVATVVEKLARGFINDGSLSLDEINEAFNSVDKRAE
jgi:phage-related tail protein